MGRLVKNNGPSLPVSFTYKGNSIYHRGCSADRGGSAVGLPRTGGWDCRGLRKILRRGERASETSSPKGNDAHLRALGRRYYACP